MQSIKSVLKIETSLERIELLLQEISNCDDYNANVLKLERIVNEINQYHFHFKQCEGVLNPNIIRVSLGSFIFQLVCSLFNNNCTFTGF